jgi:hypothetical protein
VTVSPHVISAVGHLSYNSGKMIIKNFYIIIGVCFLALSLFWVGACSFNNSSAQTSNQDSNVPSIIKVDRPKPNLNGRVYKSKTIIPNKAILKNLDCNNPSGYNLVDVENYHEEESITSRDLNIVVGDEVAVKIELPTGFEVKNFSLNSTKKNNNGFQMNTEWGGGNFHYEIQFSFRCRENNFYLYKVKNENFSTKNPDSRNYWDEKKTRITKIEPNLPIEKFVMLDYLY